MLIIAVLNYLFLTLNYQRSLCYNVMPWYQMTFYVMDLCNLHRKGLNLVLKYSYFPFWPGLFYPRRVTAKVNFFRQFSRNIGPFCTQMKLLRCKEPGDIISQAQRCDADLGFCRPFSMMLYYCIPCVYQVTCFQLAKIDIRLNITCRKPKPKALRPCIY